MHGPKSHAFFLLEVIMGRKNLVGRRFGDLSVIKEFERGTLKSFYECRCVCGRIVLIKREFLHRKRDNYKFACNHQALPSIKKKHGASSQASLLYSTYKAWENLRGRCNNPNNKDYKNYGGRGIYVCREWDSFENFLDDVGIKPDGTSIGRIDNDGPYSPDNCRWETPEQQQNNTRANVRMEGYSIKQISEMTGLVYSTIESRILRGWPLSKIITTPKGGDKPKVKNFLEDMGARNGKLTVINIYREKRKGTIYVMYKCRCDCGGEVVVTRGNFLKTFSCGCLKSSAAIERCARIKKEEANSIPRERFLYGDKFLTLEEWAIDTGIHINTLRARRKRHVNIRELFLEDILKYGGSLSRPEWCSDAKNTMFYLGYSMNPGIECTLLDEVGPFKKGYQKNKLNIVEVFDFRGKTFAACKCMCGENFFIEIQENMDDVDVPMSCGCFREVIKGDVNEKNYPKEYQSWKHIKNHRDGVTVRWRACFFRFFMDMGIKPSKDHMLFKRNEDGPYNKENCIWVTYDEVKEGNMFKGKVMGRPRKKSS
jgi:hypothetical protein